MPTHTACYTLQLNGTVYTRYGMYTFMCNIILGDMYTIVQYQLEQLHKNIPTARVSNNNSPW